MQRSQHPTPEEFAAQGVEKFTAAKTEKLPPVLKDARLRDALKCFNLALSDFPQSANDLISICERNAARVADELVRDLQKSGQSSRDERNYFLKEAIQHYTRSLNTTNEVRKAKVYFEAKELVRFIWQADKANENQATRGLLESLIQSISNRVARMHCQIFFVDALHLQAVRLSQGITTDSGTDGGTLTEEERLCLQLLGECSRPLAESEQMADSQDKETRDEIAELRRSVHILSQSCRSAFYRRQGLRLLQYAVGTDDEVNFDSVWDAVDFLRQAVLEARGHDIESEAAAHAWLGYAFGTVLKLSVLARANCKRAIELAFSMAPATRQRQTKWFRKAEKVMKRAQEEDQRKEANEQEERDGAVKAKLKPELDALNRAKIDKNDPDFIKYVYTTHPPKSPEHKIHDSLDIEAMKKAAQKALLHYHPDKNTSHGDEWRVLCSEITKLLNSTYETYK